MAFAEAFYAAEVHEPMLTGATEKQKLYRIPNEKLRTRHSLRKPHPLSDYIRGLACLQLLELAQ